jgi:peptide/nickel transport system substrate-binding protein
MQLDPKTIQIVQEQARLADPHAITDSRTLLNTRVALYDALVRRVGPGRFDPALATAWSCESDARTWAFTIREDVRFHNGLRLVASDVAASIARATSPAAGGEMATEGVMASYFEGARIETPSPDTVRITMGRPMADLLDLLVDIVILPDGEPADGLAVGTGPFQLIETGDGILIMEAFDAHWRGQPATDRLHWKAVAEASERAQLLIEGAADLAIGLGPAERRHVEQRDHARAIQSPGGLCVAFLLNAASGPCANPLVRQALNYGMNVDRIIDEVVGGEARPLNGPFTPLHAGYNPAVHPYPYDPSRARALLAEAGYRSGLELTIDLPTRLPDEAEALADRLTQDYAELEVTITRRVHADRLAYARMVRAKQIADACCFDSSPLSTYRVLREKLHGGVAGPWWQGYANDNVDALIDQAAATVSDSERHALYQHVSQLIHDDAPWLFLYAPHLLDGAGEALAGWQPDMNGVARFA